MEDWWPGVVNWPELRWRQEREREAARVAAADAEMEAYRQMIAAQNLQVQNYWPGQIGQLGGLQAQNAQNAAQAQWNAQQQAYERLRDGPFIQEWDYAQDRVRQAGRTISAEHRVKLRTTFIAECKDMLDRVSVRWQHQINLMQKYYRSGAFMPRRNMEGETIDHAVAMAMRDLNGANRIEQKLSLCGRLSHMLDPNQGYRDPLALADEDKAHGLLFHPTDGWNTSGVLIVECPSTKKPHALFVPKRLKTAHEARAWTFGMTAKEFDLATET